MKNVVGYDLTQLLVGSEGTLAIITQITLRLMPEAAGCRDAAGVLCRMCLPPRAPSSALIRRRVVPVTLELIDADSLEAAVDVCRHSGWRPRAPARCCWSRSMASRRRWSPRPREVAAACREVGALEVLRARATRRSASSSGAFGASCRTRIRHDRAAQDQQRRRRAARPRAGTVRAGRAPARHATACASRRFGHAGDGNIHVNIMIDPADADEVARARQAVGDLFAGVVALEGSISGEHGIGFSKAPYLGLELSPDVIALMKRVKQAFDPHGILNPGKIFPLRSQHEGAKAHGITVMARMVTSVPMR